jgi:hypothetical protein
LKGRETAIIKGQLAPLNSQTINPNKVKTMICA